MSRTDIGYVPVDKGPLQVLRSHMPEPEPLPEAEPAPERSCLNLNPNWRLSL